MFNNRINKESMKEGGFSLIELVVAIGILLILSTATGTMIYSDFKKNQTQQAVQVATEAAYAAVLAQLNDFDETNDADFTNIKASVGQDKVDFVIEGNTKNTLCVTGKWIDKKDDIDPRKVGKCGDDAPPIDPTAPEISDVVSKFTYKCDATEKGYLAATSVDSSTKATVSSDSYAKEINKTSNYKGFEATLKAGVKYTVTIDGKFSTLTSGSSATTNPLKNCIVSVDRLGKDTGIKTISYIGGEKLGTDETIEHPAVPELIPSEVTSLKNAFNGATNFNSPNVSNWLNSQKYIKAKRDTPVVTDMSYMFYNTEKFSKSLTSWGDKTSNVKNMSYMFSGSNFNSYLSNWDLSEVTTTKGMFQNATKFKGSLNTLSKWKNLDKSLKDVSYMFDGASSFNGDINNWNISKVTTTEAMFQNATSFNQPLNYWETRVSSVTNSSKMFAYASSFDGLMGSWKMPFNKTTERMFLYATSFDSPLTRWDIGSAEISVSARAMFLKAHSFNGDVSNWNVSKVVDMEQMFSYAEDFNQPLTNWNVSNVETMYQMFYFAKEFNQSVEYWNVSNVKDMSYMFKDAYKFNNGDLTANQEKPMTAWRTKLTNVETMHQMFMNATSFNQSIQRWDTGKVASMNGMFSNATSFNSSVYNLNTSNVVDMSYMFLQAQSFDQSLYTWNTSSVKNMDYMFFYAESFDEAIFKIDTPHVENMRAMFRGAKQFNRDISGWDVSKVNSMKEMFRDTEKFNNISKSSISTWDTSEVTNMSEMFYDAKAFNQNISGWKVCKVTDKTNFTTGLSALTAANTPKGFTSSWACMPVLSPF